MASKLLKSKREEDRKRDNYIKDKLIKAVKAKDFLWNRGDANHNLRDEGWREISEEMGIEKEKCKSMWKNLVDHFRTLLFNVTVRENHDFYDEDREFDRIKWIFFKPLLFLRDSISRKKSLSNYLKDASNQSIDSRENSEERTEPYSPFPEPEVLCTIGGEDFTICNFKIEQEFAEIEPSSDSGPEEISLKLKSREYAEPALPKKGTNCNSNNEIIIEQIETLNNDTSQVGQAPPKKGKNKNSDNQVILEQLQTIKNNISTVSNDRTDSEVFGEYVSCLMNKIPPRERIECEFEIVKILKEKILQSS